MAAGGGRAEIYQQLRELAQAQAGEIRQRYPDIPRRVSGYNLDSLLPEQGFDVARALVGSESTLVTILHAELRLVPKPAAQALVVLGYPDIARFIRLSGSNIPLSCPKARTRSSPNILVSSSPASGHSPADAGFARPGGGQRRGSHGGVNDGQRGSVLAWRRTT
jgi:FAD/FMN-containing dehydrogenase